MPSTVLRSAAPVRLLSLVAVAALSLTACGTTDVGGSEEESSGDAGPITVTDHSGEEVTLEEPADRVVTLEWAQTEDVATLGGEQVGIADAETFAQWNSAVELPEDAVDVGQRQEPSLETIGQANPDLILGSANSVPQDQIEDLEEIAPVVLLTSADTEDPLGTMEENFRTTAELLGAEEKADEVWSEYEQTLDDARSTLSEAGAEGTPFTVSYASVEGNTATFRMHGSGAQVQALGEEIGLTTAWEKSGDEIWGISESDVEGLSALPEDTLFYRWLGTEESDDALESLENNSAWTSLGFVENDAVEQLRGQWIYGGPASSQQVVEHLAETAAEHAEENAPENAEEDAGENAGA